jgi:hypothetical protein
MSSTPPSNTRNITSMQFLSSQFHFCKNQTVSWKNFNDDKSAHLKEEELQSFFNCLDKYTEVTKVVKIESIV